MKNITVKNYRQIVHCNLMQFRDGDILGFAEDFASINPESITGTIDASGFNPGRVLASEEKLDGNYSVSETLYTAFIPWDGKSSSGKQWK